MPPAVYDHVELQDSDHPDGVYRVVGTTDETVTLLQVADADGQRVHSGDTIAMPTAAYESLPAATNPDERGSIAATLRSVPTDTYWTRRAVGRRYAEQPLLTAILVAIPAIVAVGEGVLPVQSGILDGIFAGGISWLVSEAATKRFPVTPLSSRGRSGSQRYPLRDRGPRCQGGQRADPSPVRSAARLFRGRVRYCRRLRARRRRRRSQLP